MAERGPNCLIAVAGQPTTVTNSAISGIIDEATESGALADIFGAEAGISGVPEGKLVDMGAQKRRTIEGLKRTPGSVLSGRHQMLNEADAPRYLEVLRANEIGVVIMMGGLPSIGIMKYFISAAEKAAYPLICLAIPLSAENDVPGGDHTPGYGSAARFAAASTRDAARSAAAGEEPLLVIEWLGADTGWLAASTALARDAQSAAPHAILVPERPTELEALTDELRRAYQRYGHAVVVTTEGARDTEGNSLDGPTLTALMSERLGIPARYDRPGNLARVSQGAVARADAEEAASLGTLAVRLADDDCSGYVLTIQRDTLQTGDRGERGYKSVEGSVKVDQVSDSYRLLPDEYLAPGGTNVADEFAEWARPLIGGAMSEYVNLNQ